MRFVFLVPALETVFTLLPPLAAPLAPLATQSYLAAAKFRVKVSSVTLRAGE